jgi:hypothetical protein
MPNMPDFSFIYSRSASFTAAAGPDANPITGRFTPVRSATAAWCIRRTSGRQGLFVRKYPVASWPRIQLYNRFICLKQHNGKIPATLPERRIHLLKLLHQATQDNNLKEPATVIWRPKGE